FVISGSRIRHAPTQIAFCEPAHAFVTVDDDSVRLWPIRRFWSSVNVSKFGGVGAGGMCLATGSCHVAVCVGGADGTVSVTNPLRKLHYPRVGTWQLPVFKHEFVRGVNVTREGEQLTSEEQAAEEGKGEGGRVRMTEGFKAHEANLQPGAGKAAGKVVEGVVVATVWEEEGQIRRLRVRKEMGVQHIDEEEQAYLLTPAAEQDGDSISRKSRRRRLSPNSCSRVLVVMFFSISFAFVIAYFIWPSLSLIQPPRCVDTPDRGYQCQPQISHYWGQYSPFFSVSSDIPDDVPPNCKITFVQVLSRHGARDPTASKTKAYNSTIQRLKSSVPRLPSGKYNFLNTFEYTLGADQLTVFGEREMINFGITFHDRYEQLAKRSTPFIRASGEARVIESAQNFSQGFHQAKTSGRGTDADYPYPILTIPEDDGFNNTLNHGLCTSFESSPAYTSIGTKAQATFLSTFLPAITARLNTDLGTTANITATDTINLLDLCPFTTVATPLATTLSPFCYLFTETEFHAYDYYQTLGKYYGYGPGNPLGPTQGVGYVNELIARMTGKKVNDHTTVNHTIDDSNEVFPLGNPLYVDVSHDNDMTSIFGALGLYNTTRPLSNTSMETTQETKGYSAAWTVPFAGRAYFEKLQCGGEEEEFVRILVNGRVLPLETCGGDSLGRCTLSKFVQSLSFAVEGGKWDLCFPS
ncbi:MAG: hypothetical protein Q9218_003817, partial [Villophora microphyllina]